MGNNTFMRLRSSALTHTSHLAEGAGSTSREKEDAYRNYLVRMWKHMNRERKDTKEHYSKGLFGAVGGGFMLQVATNTKNLVQNAGVVAFDTQADRDHAQEVEMAYAKVGLPEKYEG
jgi:hypothetical protein